ncbi:hypothetical protein B0T13DRAFT_451415 [Neurospora crassa]|nr:hypothetical protein B0T13DRAFT_451415 [Neurospora crassa]
MSPTELHLYLVLSPHVRRSNRKPNTKGTLPVMSQFDLPMKNSVEISLTTQHSSRPHPPPWNQGCLHMLPMTDDASKLWNNYVIHSKVHAGFASLPYYYEHQAQVPKCFWYGTPSTTESGGLNIKTIPVNLSF